jgi:crossover junction endodeoxyribonuclease RusA
VTITLPIPHKALSPNAKSPGRWRKKAQQIKIHRRRAHVRTLEALKGRPAPPFTRYKLAFFFKTNRRRDDDNASASCKAYRDGIADALKMDDHHLSMCESPTLSVDPKNPRVEITLLP